MKKVILTAALFLLPFFILPRSAHAQASSCSSQGGTCKTSCSSSEQAVSATGCTAGARGSQFCCVPRSQVTPVQCPGVCRTSCGSGEVQFRNVSNCDASGQVCCSDNPLTNDPTCKTKAGEDGIDTAIGCIPISDTNSFIGFILRWAIGIGGGIAFLLIVYSAFMIMTSTGNPERLKAGQELLTSAIAGLILLIFSIFILRVIGVDILKLPGL